MSYKFRVAGFPARWSDTAGLRYRKYDIYSGSASNSPLPSTLVSSNVSAISGASTQISNFSIALSQSYVWRGYFKPDADSTSWQFRTTSKDGSYFWLDTNAENPVASLNPSDAIVDNAGVHALTTVESSNQSLSSEFYYVVTLIAGNNANTGSVTLEWRRDGGSWSSSGASYLSHDSRYADGLGEDLYTASATPASYWVVAYDAGPGDVSYAANGDRTSWTTYNRVSGNGNSWDGAYGKDGSGNGIYVFSNGSSTGELTVSSTDITDGNLWTKVDLPSNLTVNRMQAVAWANDSTNSTSGVWLAGSTVGRLFRSTNGAATWSQITVPSHDNTALFSIAGNGSGKFVTGQSDRMLISTDDGASFSSSQPFTFDAIKGVAYTNSTWIVAYTRSGESNLLVRTAADSDLTTWSSEVNLGIDKPVAANSDFDPGARANIAAANGRAVFTSNRVAEIARLDVDGTTTSNFANPTYSGAFIRDITTDGFTWMIVTNGGDVYESTDSGVTFSQTVDDILAGTASSGTDIHAVAASKHLPL